MWHIVGVRKVFVTILIIVIIHNIIVTSWSSKH